MTTIFKKPVAHTIPTPYPVGPVHIYTVESDHGLILFDTGPPTPIAMDYLQKNIDLARLAYIFITHTHPDHYGQVAFLEKNSKAEIIFSRYDTIKRERTKEYIDLMVEVVREIGIPDKQAERARDIIGWFRDHVPFCDNYRVLEDSEDLMRKLGITWERCPGHSISDIVYGLGEWAISGDVLLRDVFTAPLLDPDLDTFKGRFSNYSAWCHTIGKLKAMEGVTFLPSHNEYVDSVDERIIFHVKKLAERARSAGPAIKTDGVYGAYMKLFAHKITAPLGIYIKLSELVFIKDFMDNPDLLITALKDNGLWEQTALFINPAVP